MTQSLTPIAIQRNWKTPSEFPACPTEIDDGTIENYAERLAFGVVFSTNTFGSATTVAAEESKDGNALGVVCNMGVGALKEWTVAKITIEGDKICHENAGSFFSLQGALKRYCEIIGVALDDSIDDHC